MNSKNISRITAILVGVLATFSLAISYNALRDVAAANGLVGWQSIIWPLLVDFALIVFSLAVVRNSLYQERTAWPWLLVFLYTAGTVTFNLIHAPANLTARTVAVVAPVSLFLSFETLMAMLKSEIKRTAATASLAELTRQAAGARAALDELTGEVNTLTNKRDQVAIELSELRKKKRNVALFNSVGEDTYNKAFAYIAQQFADGKKPSGAAVARHVDRSSTLGRRLLKDIWPKVVASANGHLQEETQ